MNTASEIQNGFFVGACAVAPLLNQISRNGQVVPLEPRVMRLLVFLASRPGEVITREEIADRIWHGTIVGTDSISRAVLDLRKAFNDNPRRPEFIATIRTVGYRLVAPVTYAPRPNGHRDANTNGVRPPGHKPATQAAVPPRKTFKVGLSTMMMVAIPLLFAAGYFLLGRSSSSTPVPLQPLPLTTSPGIEFDPALSPDGQTLAFVWRGPDNDNFDLYLKKVGGGPPVRFTDHPPPGFDGTPNWSADGREVAFMRSTGSAGSECTVIIRQVASGDERKVADCHSHTESSVAWSPDGEWIVFVDRPNQARPWTLFLSSTSTLDVHQLTHPPAGYYGDIDPAFSPDGQSVAFVRGILEGGLAHLVSPAIGDIYTVDIDDGAVRQLTHDNREIPGLGWTPDGRGILFSSNRENGAFNLWKVRLSDASIHPVLVTQGMIKNPSVSLQTNRMVYEDWEGDTDIFLLKLDGSSTDTREVPTIVSSTREESMPQYSPDGSQIVFISNRSGFPEIWVSDASGQAPIQLTRFEGMHVGSPRWSPDGQWISYVSYLEGNADVFVMPASGGASRNLTSHPSYDLVPNWSNDGEWIYFGSNRTGSWQVWKIRSSGVGAAERVTRNGGFAAQESKHPEAGVLYYTRVHDEGLWQKALEGGEEIATPVPLFRKDWGNWAVGRNGIYFVYREWGVAWHVAYYDFVREETFYLTRLQGNWAWTLPGMSLSPNEAWLLFTDSDLINSDIMMVDGYP